MSCRLTRLFKPRDVVTRCVIPMSDADRRDLAELQRRRDQRRRQLETAS